MDSQYPDLPHAMPFMYYMSGFSLNMETARNIIGNAIVEIAKHDLEIKVVAFDGQFMEISVFSF